MNKAIYILILKILFLLLPICILLLFMEYRLTKIPNTYNVKRKSIEIQLDSIEVLVLGASQTLYAVNPAYFSCKGFNLSNSSQSLYYDTQLTLKYIDRMLNLKCVIVSIAYYSFWHQVGDTNDKWRDYFYYRFWDIKCPFIVMDDPKVYSLIMLYTPLETLKYAFHFFNIDLSKGLRPNGWLALDTLSNNQNISEISGKNRVEFHDKTHFEYRFKEIFSTVDSFVYECRKRGIKVVFITTPVLPTYYNYTKPETNQVNTKAILELCQKYDCDYHDYFRDNRFTNRDFVDNDHMNFVGAEKFSKILNADIIEKLKYVDLNTDN